MSFLNPTNPSHLPISHKDFRYPVCDNPYALKINDIPGRAFSDHATEEYRGHWRERMPDGAGIHPSRELHVEIGCNAGHVVLEWAAENPDQAYIGIDWKFKPIFRAAEKAIKRKIENVLFFRAHAERLEYMFAPGEIDRLYLFFPDPWPKKAHWKNRFLTADQIARIIPILKRGGIFHIKTDHPGYFEWMEEAIAKAQSVETEHPTGARWSVIERNTDLHAGHPNPTRLQIPDVTLFERLFIKDGIRIHSLKIRRD